MSTKQSNTATTTAILTNSNGAELQITPTTCTINGIEFTGKISPSQHPGKVYITTPDKKQPSFIVPDATTQEIIDKYNANRMTNKIKANTTTKAKAKMPTATYTSVDDMLADPNAPTSVAIVRDKVNARKVTRDVFTLAIDNQIKALTSERDRLVDLWNDANAPTDKEFERSLANLLVEVNDEIKKANAVEKIKHMSAKEMREMIIASMLG